MSLWTKSLRNVFQKLALVRRKQKHDMECEPVFIISMVLVISK